MHTCSYATVYISYQIEEDEMELVDVSADHIPSTPTKKHKTVSVIV